MDRSGEEISSLQELLGKNLWPVLYLCPDWVIALLPLARKDVKLCTAGASWTVVTHQALVLSTSRASGNTEV